MPGLQRRPGMPGSSGGRRRWLVVAAGGLLTMSVACGYLVARATPAQPATAAGNPRPAATGHLPREMHVLVLGDSTAAGAGLAPVGNPSRLDRACGRSAESYAADLARAQRWVVSNLACDGATVRQGLLGPQDRAGRFIPAQVSAARRARGVSAVIVSIGANDLDWAGALLSCVVARQCASPVAAQRFHSQLAGFAAEYRRLLGRLAALPGHPAVIINQYYNPFGADPGCLASAGLTRPELHIITARLAALNKVLASGVARQGFATVQPGFAGHQLCAAQPYVQGLSAPAPLHPTARGELAIARADRAALRQRGFS